ncbi:hypothetical protein COMA2_50101 [Candidatus Nitrospira nitrificans]|uniref:Uncharacterized protein n=1 Tax=Candidatus Nitrospira nitrificans TaxID=1742973 RepID=A0A0S4LLV3_9BACT|nr:hypothetical protein COMA2_50101 [Candidatus Nitrospira nitrificans]
MTTGRCLSIISPSSKAGLILSIEEFNSGTCLESNSSSSERDVTEASRSKVLLGCRPRSNVETA